jgi:hypothetical protein
MRRHNLKRGTIRQGSWTLALLVAMLLAVPVSATAATPTPAPTRASAPGPSLTPPNDNRDAPTPLGSLPAGVPGTTVGSTVEIHEPESGCARAGGSVWYSVSFGGSPPGKVGVEVQANGDLDAVVDVFQRQRSQNIPVACQRTDDNGVAGLTFSPSADSTYLIRIAQRADSAAGTFSLKVFDVPPPPTPPGTALGARGGHGVLDSTFSTEAAYSLALTAGTTYKINLVKRTDGCMQLGIFPPGTSSFDNGSIAGLSCAGYRLFTPSVTGLWSFLITADSSADGSQPFWLHIAPATSQEMAPGIFLANLSHYRGFLRGNLNADVRLFRFDVTSRSDLTLFLQTASNESFDLKLLNDDGRYLQCDCGSTGEETIRRQTPPGRYFAVVQAENFESGPFTLYRQSRTITHAHVAFDGFGYQTLAPGASTRVTATISPAVSGPVTIELEYFDPVERWQFRGLYHVQAVNGVAVLPFTPPKLGRWRATVSYNGTRSAAPATSGWANLLVAGPLTE